MRALGDPQSPPDRGTGQLFVMACNAAGFRSIFEAGTREAGHCGCVIGPANQARHLQRSQWTIG